MGGRAEARARGRIVEQLAIAASSGARSRRRHDAAGFPVDDPLHGRRAAELATIALPAAIASSSDTAVASSDGIVM